MSRDFATVLFIIAALAVLLIVESEHRVDPAPIVHAAWTASQVPLVAPCITPAPQRPRSDRRA